MKIPHKVLTLDDVQFKTHMQNNRLKHYNKILTDPDKESRLKNQECIICYYDSKIGGSALTQSNCGLCTIDLHSGNTNVDKLCDKCAKDHKLCKHCGADIAYKNRKIL